MHSSFLRPPIEEVGYLLRAQMKRTDRDLSAALTPLDAEKVWQIQNFPGRHIQRADTPCASLTRPQVCPVEASAAVRDALDRLRALKRRYAASANEEEEHLRQTRLRLVHSSTGSGAPAADEVRSGEAAPGGGESSSARLLDELLIEYMFRRGHEPSKQQSKQPSNSLDSVALELAAECGLAR